MFWYQRDFSSRFSTSAMQVKHIQLSEVEWSQEVFVCHCSEHCRQSMYGRNSIRLRQPNTRTIHEYFETSSKDSVLVQFQARSEERIAVFQTRSHVIFLSTHCLRFVLRKWYASKRRSFFTKFTNLQGCVKWNWSRIRKVDNRINLINKQENPEITKAHRKVTEKPTAATSTIEYQAYIIPQSNNRTRIAKKRSNSWFTRSRITRTRSLSCRSGIRPKRPMRSARGRRSWSPTWALRRSSGFAKPLPTHNVPIAIYIGWLALCTANVEKVQNPRRVPKSWTRITLKFQHFPVTSSTSTSPMVPNMELPNGNLCTTKPRRCCRKLDNPSMVGAKPFFERWHKDDKYRKSLSEIGWTDEQIIPHDELALEDFFHIATQKERTRNEKSLGSQVG